MGQTTAEDLYTGGCLCRVIRYELTAAPLAVLACHCTQCRRQSGAAFSVNLIVRASKLVILGWPAGWEDTETESGVPCFASIAGNVARRSGPFPLLTLAWSHSRRGRWTTPAHLPRHVHLDPIEATVGKNTRRDAELRSGASFLALENINEEQATWHSACQRDAYARRCAVQDIEQALLAKTTAQGERLRSFTTRP